MRKGVVILLAAGVVFAENPPSFREYVSQTVHRHVRDADFVLPSVDEKKSVLLIDGYTKLVDGKG